MLAERVLADTGLPNSERNQLVAAAGLLVGSRKRVADERVLEGVEAPVTNPESLQTALRAFFVAADEAHPSIALLFRVLGLGGLRLGEALSLQWQDVELTERVLHVRRTIDWKGRVGTPKSGKPRDVDLCRDLVIALTARRDSGPSAGWVFASPNGRPWSRIYLGRVMARALEAAGLSGFTRHDLRRTFATVLADGGASPWALKELLGHGDVRVTAGYVRSRKRHLDAVELLDRGNC